MSDLRLLLGQLGHQIRLLLRTPRAMSTGLVLPVLLLFLNSSNGHLPPARLAGCAVLGTTMIAWTTHGIGLVAARESGVMKRYRATPLPAWCYLTAQITASVLVAVLAGALAVLVGVVFFGTQLPFWHALMMLGVMVLGALACASASTAVTGFVPTVASAFPILGLTYLPVLLLSGTVGDPLKTHWVNTLASYLPVRPIVVAASQALSGTTPALHDVLVLCSWSVAGLLLSLAVFRWEPTRTRQRRPARTQVAIAAVMALVCVVPSTTTTRAEAATPTAHCESLQGQHVLGATVTNASVNSSGTFRIPPGQGGPGEGKVGDPFGNLPPYCGVELLSTDAASDGADHFTAWLPVDWTGRLEGVGGGGFVAGFSYGELSAAIRSGNAAISTDTGHPASQYSGEFALENGQLDQRAVDDFAYRAIHDMTVTGKDLVERYYGRGADRSYFNGCSMGGRQAITEAQRYPTDYNGIVAGAPAIDFNKMAPGQLWPVFVQQRAGHDLQSCKFDAFYKATVAACDRLDGVTDGVVGNAAQCNFNPGKLIGTSTPCGVITAADVKIVREIQAGPGLWYGLEPGSNLTYLAAYPLWIAVGWYKYWLAQDPVFDWRTMTTDEFYRLYRQGEREFTELQNDDPDLTAFRDAGGKLLLWTGLADPLIPPQGTIRFYDNVVRRMGGQDRTGPFARLFLAPGVGHCGGAGTVGPTPTDPFGAVINWVENGNAPAAIEASQAGETRPLCAYPTVARYLGHGSTDSAGNFYCSSPR